MRLQQTENDVHAIAAEIKRLFDLEPVKLTEEDDQVDAEITYAKGWRRVFVQVGSSYVTVNWWGDCGEVLHHRPVKSTAGLGKLLVERGVLS